MKIKYILAPILLAGFASQATASDCSVTIDSTDAMRFDKDKITIDTSCEEFTIKLTHSGQLAKNIMGHNVVITKPADLTEVSRDAMSAGLENQYVKPDDDRVIVFTDLIGGGEETSTTFETAKFTAGEDYTFFCSFPGHISLMKGTVTVK